MTTYEHATLRFGDHELPIGPVSLSRPAPPPPEPLPPTSWSFTCEGTFDADAIARVLPARPAGQAVAQVPFGILGTIGVPFDVVGADPMREAAEGASLTMHGEMDERLLRRAVSMAVERAIVNRERRGEVIFQTWSTDEPAVVGASGYASVLPSAEVRKRAGALYSRHHGERKRRKAMRRLLRAAGVTRPV